MFVKSGRSHSKLASEHGVITRIALVIFPSPCHPISPEKWGLVTFVRLTLLVAEKNDLYWAIIENETDGRFTDQGSDRCQCGKGTVYSRPIGPLFYRWWLIDLLAIAQSNF